MKSSKIFRIVDGAFRIVDRIFGIEDVASAIVNGQETGHCTFRKPGDGVQDEHIESHFFTA